MTIRGDTLLYKNAMGNVGTIQSEVFTKAMCDVYFGSSPVSPPAKQAVMDELCERTGAEVVQSIGNVILVLRRTKTPDPAKSNLLRPL